MTLDEFIRVSNITYSYTGGGYVKPVRIWIGAKQVVCSSWIDVFPFVEKTDDIRQLLTRTDNMYSLLVKSTNVWCQSRNGEGLSAFIQRICGK